MMDAAIETAAASHLDPRVRAAAQGDRRAQESILAEHLPRMRNLVRYFLRGDADVDDAAQRALCEVVRSLGTYRGDAPLRAWIDRITARVALQTARKQRAQAKLHTQLDPDLPAAVGADAERYALRRRAVLSLDQLPEEQRTAVVLHHVLGLSMPELAAELDIPFETARSRLRLGMEKLRSALRAGDAP
jgi:RNA polymerase sigma-70 factor (ECF subfamily)